MKVLLSGATGFLGSYLLKTFVSKGYEVIALKRAKSNTFRVNHLLEKTIFYNVDDIPLQNIFKKHDFDIVVNTVTDYGRINKQISAILDTNLMFSLKLLENAVKHNVQTFVNTDTLLTKDINAYSLSKHQFVQWMKFLSPKINMVNIKIEQMYGPLDDENKFVYWFIKQLKLNVKKIDLTSGTQKRDFIYIDDIVKAYLIIIKNINNFSSFEEFELGSGNAVEVKHFLNLVFQKIEQRRNKQLTTTLNFGAIPFRKNEEMHMEADVSKLITLGWSPTINIEDGIEAILNNELSN